MTSSVNSGPTIHLCHPFTARAIGWSDEAALPEFHSGPHAQALRQLRTARGATSTISYFTDTNRRRDVVIDGLRYRYWPRSLHTSGCRDAYRKEWSFRELLHESVRPSDVTIINFSGHGGRFSQTHARLLGLRRRQYIAMIGGAFATTSGEQRRFLEHAAAVAVHSKALYRHLLVTGFRAEQLVVVPLGVDTTHQFVPIQSGTVNEGPRLLYVGRIVELKGIHLMIEALAAISVTVPSVSLRLVGPEPDPTYSASLRETARRLGVSERVTFAGALPRDSVRAEYQQATLMVLPSQDEGYGMVVAESMACGTPVVALAGSPGPEDMITSGQDGLLVEPMNLASGIIRLLRDPARLIDLGHAARSTAVDRLSSAVTNNRFEQLVDMALTTGG